MDLTKRRKYLVKKSPASLKRRHKFQTSAKIKSCLTPLQRLERFKKQQQRQSEKPKKRVQFAMDKEPEVLNGTNESNVSDVEEKVLRPRKPHHEVVLNGNENGSPESINGHDVNGCDDIDKIEQSTINEKNENNSKKQPAKKSIKEATPQPDSPLKRELRRRESTPKTEMPLKKRGLSIKVQSAESDSESKVETKLKEDQVTEDVDEANENEVNFSDIVVENSINENDENYENKSPSDLTEHKENSFFSLFRKSPFSSSKDFGDKCEASSSSPSIICLDSPSTEIKYDLSNNDFKSRKPINSFSKFPGRTISITSLDKSTKRKADESFDDEGDKKKFAGSFESNQRKSTGWSFFSSPFGKSWSPTSQPPKLTLTSTPFPKRLPEDSMAVNYDENTKLSLDDSAEFTLFEDQPKQDSGRKRCTIM